MLSISVGIFNYAAEHSCKENSRVIIVSKGNGIVTKHAFLYTWIVICYEPTTNYVSKCFSASSIHILFIYYSVQIFQKMETSGLPLEESVGLYGDYLANEYCHILYHVVTI